MAAYLIVSVRYYATTRAKLACTCSDLGELRMPFIEFKNEHDTFPTRWNDVGISTNGAAIIDTVSKEPFVLRPPTAPAMLIIQPKRFRTALWPFGKFRQWGIDTNGYLIDILEPRSPQ